MSIHRILLTAGVLLFTVSLAHVIKVDNITDARKAIAANYAKIDQAYMNQELLSATSLYSSSYTEIDQHGRKSIEDWQGKKDFYAEIDGAARIVVNTHSIHTVIQRFRLRGNVAIVLIRTHAAFSVKDRRTHMNVKSVGDSVHEQTWKKVGALWLLSRSRTVSNKQQISPHVRLSAPIHDFLQGWP